MFKGSLLENIPTDLQNLIGVAINNKKMQQEAYIYHKLLDLQTMMPCHYCEKEAIYTPILGGSSQPTASCDNHAVCENCIFINNPPNNCYKCRRFFDRCNKILIHKYPNNIEECYLRDMIRNIFSDFCDFCDYISNSKLCAICKNPNTMNYPLANMSENWYDNYMMAFKHKTFYGEKICYVCNICFIDDPKNLMFNCTLTYIL